MTELSLNVLDIAQNSTRAKANLIEIEIKANTKTDILTITIKDDGCGMSEEQLANACDPFFTTRTTRKVGLGISLFKTAAMNSGGSFSIDSKLGEGTVVDATFHLSNIDRMPLGDITSTIHTLIIMNSNIDFLYTYVYNEKSFSLDTREFRKILDNVPFDTPEVSNYIKEFLSENKNEVDDGIEF